MFGKIKTKYTNLNLNVKASLWFVICSFFQKGISIITTPIFTRLMSTSEYGQFNVFSSWMGIVSVFVTLSIFNGIYTQGLIKFDNQRKEFSSSLQGLTFVLVLSWVLVYYSTRNFWNSIFSLSTEQMLYMFGSIWATSVFSFWAAEQRVNLKYKELVAVTIIVSVVKPIVGILLVYFSKDKVTARIFGIMLIELLAYSWIFVKQIATGKVFFHKSFWKYALLLSLPLIPHYLAQNIMVNSDRIMIEKLVGTSESGIYSLAYSLAQIMLIFCTALSQAISPWLMKRIKVKQLQGVGRIIEIGVLLIATATLLLITVAPEITRLFAPAEYYAAIWCIPPVALSVIFQFLYLIIANVEFFFEKTKLIAVTTLLCAGLNIGLNFLFIPVFGYYAAAYTTLVCYVVQFLCHIAAVSWISKKYLNGMRVYNSKSLLLIGLIATAIGFLMLFTYEQPIIRYGVLLIIIIMLCIFSKKIVSFLNIFRKSEDLHKEQEF